MNEKIPDTPSNTEAHGSTSAETPTAEFQEQSTPAGSERPATEPGQFRTAPLTMDPSLQAPTRQYPSTQAFASDPSTIQGMPLTNPVRNVGQEPSEQMAWQPQPMGQADSAPMFPGGPTFPGGPQGGSETFRHPAYQQRPYTTAPGDFAYASPGSPQGLQTMQNPVPVQPVGPAQTMQGQAAMSGQVTGPIQASPGQVPLPGAAPLLTRKPPRRRKPLKESVVHGPITGAMPITNTDVTDIPHDGPIEWPRNTPGVVGVGNLFLSAIMAVVWAWIPVGLLVTGIGGLFALGLGVLALLVWLLVQQGANVFERYRSELVYGDRIPVPIVARSTRESGLAKFLHNRWLVVKSAAFWRSTAHHFIKMLLGTIVVGGAVTGICVAIYGVFAAINPEGVTGGLWPDAGLVDGGIGRIGAVIISIVIFASSLAVLWFAPYLDRALDRALLPAPRTAALQAEVSELDRARVAGIDAATAERLRIERDLHDGAQPRLVALSMTLGMAKSKIDSDPERAKELVSEAHAESKSIVNELRQLARGIHPAVLTDRGLDAAVSGLAGRSPIPVEVDVRLSGRIGREAEAVSYFVIAECLTNIAKHSSASQAKVLVAPLDTGIQIVVTDNGQGGARIDRSGRHTGIAGLVDRVEAARGTLNLTSPAGGPTTIVVEVPCAS